MKLNVLAERLLLTLWARSLWAIGYLAVPLAFASLADSTMAGNYAAKLFFLVNILGLGCGFVLLVSQFIRHGNKAIKNWRCWVLLVMLILTLILSYYLQPEIVEMSRIAAQDDVTPKLLHAISKNIYMIVSLLALVLIISDDKALV